jgi:hypothetical protein
MSLTAPALHRRRRWLSRLQPLAAIGGGPPSHPASHRQYPHVAGQICAPLAKSLRLRTFSPTWKTCNPRREDENSEPLMIEKEEKSEEI